MTQTAALLSTEAISSPKPRRRSALGGLLVAPLGLWLLAAFALPLGVVTLLSFQPTADLFEPLSLLPSLEQYGLIIGDGYYRTIFFDTLLLGAGVSVISAVLGYPIALWLVRLPPRWRAAGVALILVPLLTNVVVRSLGIMLILSPAGVVSQIVTFFGLPEPRLLFNWFSVGVALIQVFLPYMVMSLYDSLQSVDRRVEEAAASLGAPPIQRFFSVILPLSLPGLRSGLVIVFLMTSTAYVSATLLGGKNVWTSGMVVFEEAIQLLNHPKASAMAMLMLVASLAASALIGWVIGRLMPWTSGKRPLSLPRLELPTALAHGASAVIEALGPWVARLLLLLSMAMLLFPMVLVVVSSVNDSPQATVATFVGFTWKWYGLIFDNVRYIDAFIVSLQLAFASVIVALALSLPAAFALARHPLPGREIIMAMFMLPLALPGIAIALGMLRLLQWFMEIPPFLGLLAVHVVLIAPFTLALLRTSVAQLDKTLEEAGAGLGAGPFDRLRYIILPQLTPGMLAAGIIGFLISFGEVTVTAFLTTARMQTLPVRIYAEATFSLENTVNAVSTLIILMTVLLLIGVNRFVRLDRVWHR
ncbi:iron ABC transporter permease [Telmatospirillum sp. J64-1]|uniref:ABC transporter permease n=1 Tax=Telmatospirillum sp. J64-1 TaxID=2502183 RepID=UPI00115CD159|nr:iron ABC transporter permease [Telmatospirillum sp. J64-1]